MMQNWFMQNCDQQFLVVCVCVRFGSGTISRVRVEQHCLQLWRHMSRRCFSRRGLYRRHTVASCYRLMSFQMFCLNITLAFDAWWMEDCTENEHSKTLTCIY